jgi:hypothetical protein
MTSPAPTWLRASAAAALVGVSRRTIAAWVANGVIPPQHLLRTGSCHRISRVWCLGYQAEPPVNLGATNATVIQMNYRTVGVA